MKTTTTNLAFFVFVCLFSFQANAQRYLQSAKPLSYTNDTLKVEVKAYFYIEWDRCQKIVIEGQEQSSLADITNVKLYYTILFLSHSAPNNCIITDTVAIKIPNDTKQVNFEMYAVEYKDTVDTVDVNSSLPIFLPLTIPNSTIGNTAVTVAPNPASDMLTVKGITKGTLLNCYNATGQRVYQEVVLKAEHTITISELPVGVYTLSWVNSDGEVYYHKFLKE